MSKRNAILVKLGLNIRKVREAKELTQEKLAEKAGLDPTYISRNAGGEDYFARSFSNTSSAED